MKFLSPVLALLILLFPFPELALAGSGGSYVVFRDQFKLEDRTYEAITILTRPEALPGSPDSDPALERWAESQLSYAWDWLVNQYVIQERMAPDSHIFQAFTRNETIQDERSAIVMIVDPENPRNIYAMVRYAFQGLGSQNALPLSKTLGSGISYSGLEWKNFVRRTGSDRRLVAALFDRVLSLDVLKTSFAPPMAEIQWSGLASQTATRRNVFGETDEDLILHYVREYGARIVDYVAKPGEPVTEELRSLLQLHGRQEGKLKSLIDEYRLRYGRKFEGFFVFSIDSETYAAALKRQIRLRLNGQDRSTLGWKRLPSKELYQRQNSQGRTSMDCSELLDVQLLEQIESLMPFERQPRR